MQACRRLYRRLFIACIVGYFGIYYMYQSYSSYTISVCPIKHIFHIPCPSCGSTRSIISLLHGNIIDSIYINPLGILLTVIIILSPIWIMIDFFTKSQSLFMIYKKIDQYIRKKPVIIVVAVILMLSNWTWNIIKGL